MANKNNIRYKKRKNNIHQSRPLTTTYDKDTVFIKDWYDLRKVESLTHYIEFGDCNGHIYAKDGYSMVINGIDYIYGYYLSTHTFYGLNYKTSERVLRSCGFNVKMNNWDEEGSEY